MVRSVRVHARNAVCDRCSSRNKSCSTSMLQGSLQHNAGKSGGSVSSTSNTTPVSIESTTHIPTEYFLGGDSFFFTSKNPYIWLYFKGFFT
jgi:hypothetical protein